MTAERRAFTLIELLVVLALISLAAGMTIVQLDGLSGSSRLRAAASQHSAAVRLARIQAMSSGEPRQIDYGAAGLSMRRPIHRAGRWEWDDGMHFEIPSQVSLVGLCFERADGAERKSVVVQADGQVMSHVALFRLGNQWMGILFEPNEEPRYQFFEGMPSETSWKHWMEHFGLVDEKP